MDVINRVYEICNYVHISIYKLSKDIGVSNSYFSKQKFSNGSISSNIIQKLLYYSPEINPEWLLTGRGEMIRDGKTPPPDQPSKFSPFFERLTQIAENKGFNSMNDFALNGLGYNSAEKLNRLKKEENKPSYTILTDITNKFADINSQWLLTGEGEMLKTCQRTFLDSQNSIEDAILNKVKEKLLPELDERISKLEELIKKHFSQNF